MTLREIYEVSISDGGIMEGSSESFYSHPRLIGIVGDSSFLSSDFPILWIPTGFSKPAHSSRKSRFSYTLPESEHEHGLNVRPKKE